MWFRLPLDASAPPLISEAAGIERIVARPAGTYTMLVTVLDSPQARLLRAGITVCHRVRDGEGEWYIASKAWPGLPREVSYEVGESGNLPADLQHKLNLFLREEAIGPFATMECDRHEYVLRGEGGDIVEIRDDIITISKDGVERFKARELVMTPLVKLSGQQREFIHTAMQAVDASVLERPPSLQERIGPPATGLTSFRPPSQFDAGMTLEEYVAEVLLTHLHALLLAELDDDRPTTKRVLSSLDADLHGLSPVIEPAWRESLEDDVRALPGAPEDDIEAILVRIIDALVAGVRAPKLGDLSNESARGVLFSRAEHALIILLDRCRSLTKEATDEEWSAALRSAEHFECTAKVTEPLFPKQMRKLRNHLDALREGLRASVMPAEDVELVGLSAEDAYQLGRDMEHARWSVARARRAFVDAWPSRVPKMSQAMKKMRKQAA